MTRAGRSGLVVVLAVLTRVLPVAGLPGAALSLAQSAEPIAVEVTSRAMVPGELVVLTISAPARASSVRVTVFRKDVPAFRLTDDRWRALVGIDLDQRPGRYNATIAADLGTTVVRVSKPIVVRARMFATRRLQVDPEFVNPPKSELTRISQEATFLRDVYASSATSRLWSESFVRPVEGQANSRFGSRSVFNGEPRSAHGGADFLSPSGTPIKSPNAGRIVCARDLFFTGRTVIVDHGLGVFSLLAHLSQIDVSEGDVVTAGQVVGLVGATGRVTGPHLHWALNVWGARVDPLSALALLGTKDKER